MPPDTQTTSELSKVKPAYHAIVELKPGPQSAHGALETVSAPTKRELKAKLSDSRIETVHAVFRGKPVVFQVGRAVSL